MSALVDPRFGPPPILVDPGKMVKILEQSIRNGNMNEEELERLLRYVARLTRFGVSVPAQIECLEDRFGMIPGATDPNDPGLP